MELNKIHQGDCLELLKQVPDNSIHLVLTDPPYGDGVSYGRNEKEIENNQDETINYKVLPLLYSKIREGGVCYLFTNWKFSAKLQNFINADTKFKIRMQIVVVKNNFGMGYGFRNQYELCLVLEKGEGAKYNLNDFSNVIKMQHIQHDEDTHPHEKGLEMIKKIVLHSSNEGDTVLDPFLGSGTTALACKYTKRNFIGMEISPEYCEIARQRLRQDSLF